MTDNTEKLSAFERIYEVVMRIPKGYVASYGQVAALAGNSRWSRVGLIDSSGKLKQHNLNVEESLAVLEQAKNRIEQKSQAQNLENSF